MGTVNAHTLSPGIVSLALSNPRARNAFTEPMADAFLKAVRALENEPELRVVILRGEGEHFSAGGDLPWLESKAKFDQAANKRLMSEFYDSFLSIRKLQVPVVASIDGNCIGAALCLACAADIRIASDRAKFGFTFVKLGLHPGMGGSYFVPRIVGAAVASDLLISGRIIDAAESLRIGLVSQVFPAGLLSEKTLETAKSIRSAGPEVLKQLLVTLRNPQPSLDESLNREASLQAENYAGKEFAEGIRAAIEKRKPSWNIE